MSNPTSPNRLLASLIPADFELLRPHLKPVELVNEVVLFEPGATIDRVYFPHSGIISLVVELSGGQAIEAAMIGRDSMLGATSALDGQVSLNKAIVQLPGAGETLDVAHFRQVAAKGPALRTTLLRHDQVIFVQAQQSAACNASHAVEARLARWLLRSRSVGERHAVGIFSPNCSGSSEAAFRQLRTPFNRPASSTTVGDALKSSTYQVFAVRLASATERSKRITTGC
jgi:CRP-like cAMP-binding protein